MRVAMPLRDRVGLRERICAAVDVGLLILIDFHRCDVETPNLAGRRTHCPCCTLLLAALAPRGDRCRSRQESTHHATMLPWRALLATRAPAACNFLARWLSNKRHSGAKKRFRATQRGAIKRKAAGMGHNTGLRRQHRQTRKRFFAPLCLLFESIRARRSRAPSGARVASSARQGSMVVRCSTAAYACRARERVAGAQQQCGAAAAVVQQE